MPHNYDPDALIVLDMEYKLQVAFKINQDDIRCAAYLLSRREILLPAIYDEAEKQGQHPEDLCAQFVTRVHERHEAGLLDGS